MSKVKILNKTGNPADTKIFIDDVELPQSNLMSVDISMRPDNIVTAEIELYVTDVDVIGELVK